MLYYLVAALLLAHAVYWGAGLALLVLPREWRRAWWVLAAAFGWSLQSAVVWMGAHLPLAGTNAYALATEAVPLALLLVAWRRRAWRAAMHGWVGLMAALVFGGALLLWPLAQRGAWTLTSASLGSCDHADYAAGARVLQEFSRSDRVGFLDLPEVTRVGDVERFFDYWLELNHFSPSAIIAHNAAVFGFEPHELVSVTAAVFWLGTTPLVLLLARALGWRRRARVIAAVLFAVSPLGAYAVHQAAMGQMLAAQGIALLTLLTAALVRGPVRPARFLAVGLVAYWLLAGSYNFILVIALAPAAAAATLALLASRSGGRLGPLVLVHGGALIACAVIFAGRFTGLAERFRLLAAYDFGWPVPLMTPEGWAGAVRTAELAAWPVGVRVLLAALVLTAFVGGLAWQWSRRREAVWRAVGWVLTVAGGWAVLAWESRTRPNASYDAYKVIMVFLPLLLPALLLGCGAAGFGRWSRWIWAGALAWTGLTLFAAADLARRMVHPPLRVDRPLTELRQIEADARVSSLNLRVEEFWSRLWANAFLLRRPHYFATHTYEARLNTELKGQWDLRDGLLRSLPGREGDQIALNARFHLVRAAAAGQVALAFGENWHAPERAGEQCWRWAGDGAATIQVDNPSPTPVRVAVAIRARALQPTRLTVAGQSTALGRAEIGPEWTEWTIPALALPAGRSSLVLSTDHAAQRGGPDDPRRLSFALAELTVRALP
jgi:hypothetical protein